MRLNKVCNIEDWQTDGHAVAMQRMLPFFFQASVDYPSGMEHRKHWEFAQIVLGLDSLGVLDRDAMVLAVAAGHEAPIFELTNRSRWVFATDIYGTGHFAENEADMAVVRDPDSVAKCAYNRRRLVVQYMDALDLRYEDGSFDAVYSLSSIEHFGGLDGVRRALAEQHRVVKPGGIVAFTTEVIVNDADTLEKDHLLLTRPEQLDSLCHSFPGLSLVEDIDFSVSPLTKQRVISLADALADSQRGHTEYPHVLMEESGRHFTSISVFLRRID